MNISFDNKALIESAIEVARLNAIASAGTNVTLTVDDNNGISLNQFLMIGNLMFPKTEIAKVNSAVTLGTAVQVDALTFSHSERDTIYAVQYDQVNLYSSPTQNGTKTLVETKDIDVDQRFTDFVVSDNATGYYFFALSNSHLTTISSYSSGFLVSDYSNKTVSKIKEFVEIFYTDDFDNEAFKRILESVVEAIFGMRSWSFREKTATFTTTTGTYVYDIAETMGITDWGKMISARTSLRMLNVINNDEDDILSLSPVVMVPHTIFEYAGNLHIRIPSADTVTIKYLKNTESLINAGDKTSIYLMSAIAYGVLELLYIAKDSALSDKFRAKMYEQIKIMKKLDEPDMEMGTLSDFSRQNRRDVTPNIT